MRETPATIRPIIYNILCPKVSKLLSGSSNENSHCIESCLPDLKEKLNSNVELFHFVHLFKIAAYS